MSYTYQGFDVSGYYLSSGGLTSSQAQCMYDNGFRFVGRYIGGQTPSPLLSLSEAEAILGYLVLGVFYEVTSVNSSGLDSQGNTGTQAANIALTNLDGIVPTLEKDGVISSSQVIAVYLSCDDTTIDWNAGGPAEYIRAFQNVIAGSRYTPAIYAASSVISECLSAYSVEYTWVANYSTSLSGYTIQQTAQDLPGPSACAISKYDADGTNNALTDIACMYPISGPAAL